MFGLFNRIPSISTGELQQKLNKDLILLDVRTPSEYRGGHIAAAKNVPLNKIANYQQRQNEPVYVICQSGMRSKQAAKILKNKGYDVVNVTGGMNRWNGPIRGGK
ncbi:rhodanese-like domain-containing protein [Enterococcus asini]|uniref:rhodanese-like domain-containing protein n=1 Tax=Enterococcus TaxID=1350 RepID=UPI002892425B|nr:rhodanese-like domain-containing protein [Enterococcus asini]MDT2758028.1 rhodanese-like domain-containing protein [Enterococcus asini]